MGQNFLTDEKIINDIASIGGIDHKQIVLEVGPGTGALTKKILEKRPKKLIVIEKDKFLANNLLTKFGDNLEIVNDDMLNVSYSNFYNKRIIIFGNLPYNISTQILVKWIKINELDKFCKKFVLMFQKEVADRIISKVHTKNYGRLSILSNWKMEIEKIFDIEPESFKPSPKLEALY